MTGEPNGNVRFGIPGEITFIYLPASKWLSFAPETILSVTSSEDQFSWQEGRIKVSGRDVYEVEHWLLDYSRPGESHVFIVTWTTRAQARTLLENMKDVSSGSLLRSG